MGGGSHVRIFNGVGYVHTIENPYQFEDYSLMQGRCAPLHSPSIPFTFYSIHIAFNSYLFCYVSSHFV